MFVEGDLYYRITYPDRNLLYPSIETFVFIGQNLSDDDTMPTWYFQYAKDFGRHGSILGSDQGDRLVCTVTEEDKGDMLDMHGMLSELTDASNRRKDKLQDRSNN